MTIPERQQSVGGEKGFASSEQNEKDEGSVSEGKEEEDAENMSIDSAKAQEESSSEAKPAEGVTESLHGDGSDKEEVSSSDEEKKPAVTRDAVEKSDSEDVHGDDAGIFGKEQHMSDEKTGSADEEISDDEPLVLNTFCLSVTL